MTKGRSVGPSVFPFRAVQYSEALRSGQTADLSALVAPPYDVLDAQGKARLLARADANIVAVDLPHLPAKELGPVTAYDGAAGLLSRWMESGVLAQRDRAAMFVYRQRFTFEGRAVTRTGMACTIAVRPFGPGRDGRGGVLPHEQTFSGPKEDRMALMKATGMQLSPIFGLHQDERGTAALLLAAVCETRQPDATATTDDGTLHEVWTIDDAATVGAYQQAMQGEDVFIADGHHRYNTALNYLKHLEATGPVSEEHPARRCLFVMVSMSDPGLVIGPTHRVLGGMSGYSMRAFGLAARGVLFMSELNTRGEAGLRALEGEMQRASARCGKNVLGLYDFATGRAHLVTPVEPDPLARFSQWSAKPLEWRQLDVALCQHLIVERLCQPFAGSDEPIRWAFPHSIQEVIDIGLGLERGSGGGKDFVPQLAVIVRPTPLESVRKVSRANELMPQKSTFFYPKLATGLFLNPLT